MTTTLVATPDPDRRRAFATGRVVNGRVFITVIPQQESPKPPSDPAALRRFVQKRKW